MDYDDYVYRQYIRKFATCDILEYYSLESIDIYKHHKNGIKIVELPIYYKKNGLKYTTHKFHIAQWNLLELCFNAIKYSNDYRSKKIDENEHYKLINITNRRTEILENVDGIKECDLHKHMLCIANMEFDLEHPKSISRFNRIYHIMISINKNPKFEQSKKICYIDFSKKFYEITGFDQDVYLRCYFMIYLLVSYKESTDIMSLIKNMDFDISIFGFTLKQLITFIELVAKDYDFYKKYENWNILKCYPIVKTKKESKYIVTNLSSLVITLSETLYWTIRNHYYELQSGDFTSYFGHCFEFYVAELFETYNILAEKIPEDNVEKRPDWKLETKKYVFYIEQKAALYSIDTRNITLENRIDAINKYILNNIKKAFIQLNKYDEGYNKPLIRICLTFENINFPETLQDMVIDELELNGATYLNWIITIDEFEKLMYLLSINEAKFNSIVDKKIELERTKVSDGRSFDKILDGVKNDYIYNKINYFETIIRKEFKKYKNN